MLFSTVAFVNRATKPVRNLKTWSSFNTEFFIFLITSGVLKTFSMSVFHRTLAGLIFVPRFRRYLVLAFEVLPLPDQVSPTHSMLTGGPVAKIKRITLLFLRLLVVEGVVRRVQPGYSKGVR